MSLTIKAKNLGVLRQAELTLGDITIITGENNTGKSLFANAIHGLLWMHPECVDFELDEEAVAFAIGQSELKVDLTHYINEFDAIKANMCSRYVSQLDRVLFTYPQRFENTTIAITTDELNIKDKKIDGKFNLGKKQSIKYTKPEGSTELSISFKNIQDLIDKESWGVDSKQFPPAKSLVNTILSHAMLSDLLPCPFIITPERAGMLMFQDEISFQQIGHLDKIAQKDRDVDLSRLLRSGYPRYPLPVHEELDFLQGIWAHVENGNSKGSIADKHPDILDEFSCIVGGDYLINEGHEDSQDLLYFLPKKAKRRLRINECSSMVKSLATLGLYLKYGARPGDLLMIDTPEVGLHPASQRWMARLFAQLANVGVKVFIVTHSDYIVKEFNALVMLNQDKPHCRRIAQENGYRDNELLTANQIRSYETDKDLMETADPDDNKKDWQWVLKETDVDKFLGVEVPNFDKTINDMNEILSDIVWGAE